MAAAEAAWRDAGQSGKSLTKCETAFGRISVPDRVEGDAVVHGVDPDGVETAEQGGAEQAVFACEQGLAVNVGGDVCHEE